MESFYESDEYQWITQEEFLMEVKNLEYLMQDFCRGSDLYKYEDVCTNMQAIRDIIVRVHKRKHYFKVFHNQMITSE